MYKDYEIKLNAILDKHGVQKVELGSVKELQKQIKGMQSALKYVDGKLNEGEKYLKELEKYRQFSLSVYSKLIQLNPKMHLKAQEILNKFEKAAKDIGVNVNNVSEVKEITKLIDVTEAQMKETQTLIKKFEKKGFK